MVIRSFINGQVNISEAIIGFFFFVCSISIYLGFKKFRYASIQPFMAGSTNSGYFGIPFIVSVFGESMVGLAISCATAYLIYEGIVGYKTKKLLDYLQIPLVLAIILGFIISLSQLNLIVYNSSFYKSLEVFIYPTFTFVGSLLIGVGLSQSKNIWPLKISDLKFLIIRQVVWLAVVLVVFAGILPLLQISLSYQQLISLILLSLTPIAGNSVLIAQKTGESVSNSAYLVFWSSLFSGLILLTLVNFI